MENKEIVLDTNFIIACIKEKIDFLTDLVSLVPGADIVVPEQVLVELVRIKDNKGNKKNKLKDREAASLGLQILEKALNSGKIRKIKLEKKFVDKGILTYVQKLGNEKIYVASLDRELRGKIKNIIIIRSKKKLVIV